MQKKITFLTLLTMFSTFICAQPISNVNAKTDENRVIINYSLLTKGSTTLELYFSEDNGTSWEGPLNNVTWDAGYDAVSGQKQAIWDVLKDKEIFTSEKVIFKIKLSQNNFFLDQRDNKMYSTITINDQEWMAENLNFATPSGSWCYNDDSISCTKYGRLYDYKTAKQVCPEGWHLPSKSEWETLFIKFGGIKMAGGKLKSVSNWKSPNTGATDESKLSLLPGGSKKISGIKMVGGIYKSVLKRESPNTGATDESKLSLLPSGSKKIGKSGFNGAGEYGNFWSSSLMYATGGGVIYNELIYESRAVNQLEANGFWGLSVRCLRHKSNSEISGLSKVSSFSIIKEGYPVNKILPVFFIKNYVEMNIAKWQKKGEFEKSNDYRIRVTEQSRNQKVQELTNEAVETYKTEYSKTIDWSIFKIDQYDADNETFLIKSEQFGDFVIQVPGTEAQSLKQNWNKVQFKNTDFIISNNDLIFSKTTIINSVNGKSYVYDSKKSTLYSATNITYNFSPIQVDVPTEDMKSNNTKIETNSVVYGRDPVDSEIPNSVTAKENKMTFALIIGNEDYKNEIKVPFAKNDATIFNEYCKKTLGIPQGNIRLLLNGTYGQMLGEVKWIKDVIKAYNGEAHVIFYYAGHGMPDEKDKTAYMLPADGNSTISQTALKLDDLYADLALNPSKSVTVFLDACFSGAAREGSLSKGRGVRIAPNENTLTGNIIVFTATSADETALPYTDKGHGLFTYFILKKLQETRGDVSMSDLSLYVIDNVTKQSVVVNNKIQNPKINVSPSIQDKWQNLKLN